MGLEGADVVILGPAIPLRPRRGASGMNAQPLHLGPVGQAQLDGQGPLVPESGRPLGTEQWGGEVVHHAGSVGGTRQKVTFMPSSSPWVTSLGPPGSRLPHPYRAAGLGTPTSAPVSLHTLFCLLFSLTTGTGVSLRSE